jgi:hypothetical protein
LETSEAGAYPQINFLSCKDGISQVGVWISQLFGASCRYVLLCEGTEMGSFDNYLGAHLLAKVNHIIGNSLSFPVAIKPENQQICT